MALIRLVKQLQISSKVIKNENTINLYFSIKKMKIGIITYDVPHLKTQEVFFRLLEKKYKIYFFFIKFKKYKKRTTLINHRPFQFTGPDIFQLSRKYKIKIDSVETIKSHKNIKYFLICGGGIIDHKLIIKNKIINCHPGLIPMTRGLDSFKWSILNNLVIGNTLHFIDQKIDSGKIISHKKTPIFCEDSFESLAKRHYEFEIDMLVNFESYIKKQLIYNLKSKTPTKRMPFELQKKMINNFERFKNIIIDE